MPNVKKSPEQKIQELEQQIKEILYENKHLKETNEHLTKQNKEFADLLLRARAQLQLFKDASKNNYLLTLNLKEI